MNWPAGSSLEVLRELLGVEPTQREIDRLSDRQLLDIAAALEDYCLAWRAPQREPDEFRVCISDRYSNHRSRLSDLVLWAHKVVVRDPLEEWLEETAATRWEDDVRANLAEKVAALKDLDLSVEHGAVILAPYPSRLASWGRPAHRVMGGDEKDKELALAALELMSQPLFVSSVLGDVDERAWRLTIADGDPEDADTELAWRLGELDGVPQEWVDAVSLKAATKLGRLAHCSRSDARFVPFSASDEALVRLALPEALGAEDAGVDEGVFQTLLHVGFPQLDGLSTSDALVIRRDEESFARWRGFIADLLLDSNAKAQTAGISLQELVNESMDLIVRDAREAVSRSASLKKYAAGEMRIRLTLTTAAAALAAATSSPAPAVIPALQFAIDVLRAGMPKVPSDPPGVVVRMLRTREV